MMDLLSSSQMATLLDRIAYQEYQRWSSRSNRSAYVDAHLRIAVRGAVAAAAPLIEAAARADERAKLTADGCHLSAACPRCGCTGPDIDAPTKGFCSHCRDWPERGIVGGRVAKGPPDTSWIQAPEVRDRERSSVPLPADRLPELPLVRCLRCEHSLGECVCQDDKVMRGVR